MRRVAILIGLFGCAEQTRPDVQVNPCGGVQRPCRASVVASELPAGELTVRSNVDRGIVFINGEPRALLVNGAAQLSGLRPGKYAIVVEHEGRGRCEVTVDIP